MIGTPSRHLRSRSGGMRPLAGFSSQILLMLFTSASTAAGLYSKVGENRIDIIGISPTPRGVSS